MKFERKQKRDEELENSCLRYVVVNRQEFIPNLCYEQENFECLNNFIVREMTSAPNIRPHVGFLKYSEHTFKWLIDFLKVAFPDYDFDGIRYISSNRIQALLYAFENRPQKSLLHSAPMSTDEN